MGGAICCKRIPSTLKNAEADTGFEDFKPRLAAYLKH
jgi:hypothetical protein